MAKYPGFIKVSAKGSGVFHLATYFDDRSLCGEYIENSTGKVDGKRICKKCRTKILTIKGK